jgi:hypothetical protein
MVKFDNFGQDYIVSDNLHGIVDSDISGKLHIHKDLTPMLDKSNFTIDLKVVNGQLDNYAPLSYLEDFFKDKNLNKVRFDTLENTFDFKSNVLTVPTMTINSSLGFIELWGTQNLNDNMNMFFKVPLKLVTKAAFQKLFKRKREDVNPTQEEAIEYQDKDKKIAYVYVNLLANANGYEVKLQRDKKSRKLAREKRRQQREERQARQAEKRKARLGLK